MADSDDDESDENDEVNEERGVRDNEVIEESDVRANEVGDVPAVTMQDQSAVVIDMPDIDTPPQSVESIVEGTIKDMVVQIITAELFDSLLQPIDENNNLLKTTSASTDFDLPELDFLFGC